MLDAICDFDKERLITYSIFDFKALAEADIDKFRYSLLCPVCKQKAYFRRASIDGKQACFGSRYHKTDCSEFNPSARKIEEEKQVCEVEKMVLDEQSLTINFSLPVAPKQKSEKPKADKLSVKKEKNESQETGLTIKKHSLSKLLTSLLRGSSLAESDLWIYTSEKHKWRAKNLFVNIKDAVPTDNNAPRLYWGTLSHADQTLNWLNPAEERSVALPISKYRELFMQAFSIKEPQDVEGAAFILFGKCFASKDKKRKYIQLWDNDLQYFYLSKA